MTQYIFEFVLALAGLIIVHELGHFIACRIFKVEVEEFGLGIPPRALTLFRAGGTDFTLNWIPLGGFVRPRGENDPQVPGGLASARPLVRIGVALAGPLMNILLAVVLYAIISGLVGEPDPARLNQVEIQGVLRDSPAETAGLQIGDIMLAVNGQAVHSTEETRNIIYDNLDMPVAIRVQRGESITEITVTPLSSRPLELGATGLQMGTPMRPVSLWQAAGNGFSATYRHIVLFVDALFKLATGKMEGEAGMVGPIGMGRFYVDMREYGPAAGIGSLMDVFGFIISITISLGLFNLLPIPALDGGRILLSLPELLFHRRVAPKVENGLIAVTMLLLLGLLILVSLRDIFFPTRLLP